MEGLLLIILGICLAVSFLMSGMEAGVFALSRLRIRQQVRAGNHRAIFQRRQRRISDKGERQPAGHQEQSLVHDWLLGHYRADLNPASALRRVPAGVSMVILNPVALNPCGAFGPAVRPAQICYSPL